MLHSHSLALFFGGRTVIKRPRPLSAAEYARREREFEWWLHVGQPRALKEALKERCPDIERILRELKEAPEESPTAARGSDAGDDEAAAQMARLLQEVREWGPTPAKPAFSESDAV
jgi:hypothetical protein